MQKEAHEGRVHAHVKNEQDSSLAVLAEKCAPLPEHQSLNRVLAAQARLPLAEKYPEVVLVTATPAAAVDKIAKGRATVFDATSRFFHNGGE